MDNKKFEQLIEFILNENEEQARALFHDIVVEKSREIYESMMDDDMDEGMGGQVGDMLDEIDAEHEGMTEEEEDLELDMIDDEEMDSDDEEMDSDDEEMDDFGDMGDEEGMGDEEELEDRVMDLEDKLDQLMADFEAKMGSMDDEEGLDESQPDAAALRQERNQTANSMANMKEETLEEAVQLQKVSVSHGDNGAYTTSPGLKNSGQAGMDSKPVKFSGAAETVPTGPKGASNAYAKGETQVKGAGQFKNAPGHKGQDLDKAPAPVKSQASGVNQKSPVAESKKIVKKIVK